ncbi:MAG: hypothetical protein NTY19_08655 [Planctomycetota bacterium]|nr:hypothetical protein [Planctomycetota bacterium]
MASMILYGLQRRVRSSRVWVPAAVDATVASLMNLCPEKIGYLRLAADRLGPIDDRYIDQRGELWRPLAQPFAVIEHPELQRLRV